jgi:alkanesulfonate monooxygenase SsuD/methylene tetrahydromethanopterin reductase-like flavin-dependent oxidoreductase (luciferase family)
VRKDGGKNCEKSAALIMDRRPPMKFGLHFQLPSTASQSPVQRYRDTLDQCVHAESLGFESVWPVEQHFNSELSILPAPMLMLAALAERTRTLRLGIAITLLPLWHPLRIAEGIGTLDVISNGRVEFGIGRGSLPRHFSGFGIEMSENRERFLEGLEVILKSWTDEHVTHHGRFFDIDNLSVVPKPVQKPHPPIRVAANSPETFELMGRLGYQIFAAAQVNPFPRIREYLPIYRDARKAAGHPDNGPEDVTILTPLYVGDSEAQIRQYMEPSLKHFLEASTSIYTSPEGRQKAEPIALQRALERSRMTYEQACQLMAVYETPNACVDRLGHLREDFNTGRIICWFNTGGLVPHDQVMRSMELFAAKVMPQLA